MAGKIKTIFFAIILLGGFIILLFTLNYYPGHPLISLPNQLTSTNYGQPFIDNVTVSNVTNFKRIIHQSWKSKTQFPMPQAKWIETWKTCFPTYEYKLWDDTDNRKFIVDYYPWFLETYDSFRSNIHRADSLRYFYLFHYGGIYTDIDTECVQPFDHLIKPYNIVLGAMTCVSCYSDLLPEGHIQNSFMYSVPSHPFWLELIFEIMKRAASPTHLSTEHLTGPHALMDAIKTYRKRNLRDIKIYKPEIFNPISWINRTMQPCKQFAKMNKTDWLECRALLNNSYVIQYHAHSW